MTDPRERTWTDSMPEAYERWLAPAVFQPFAAELAARVSASRPQRVLELAAGTGVLTRAVLAAVDSATVTATDLNRAMVDVGRQRAPHAAWCTADATLLPFRADAYDVVACQFGVMFFPDRPAAYRDAARTLRSGGRLLFSTWGTVEEHDFAAAMMRGLERAFPGDAPTFPIKVPHGYTDVAKLRDDVESADLDCVAIETITLDGTAPSAHAVASGFCTGTPLRGEIARRRASLDAVVEAVADAMADDLGRGPIRGRMTAHVVEAARRVSR